MKIFLMHFYWGAGCKCTTKRAGYALGYTATTGYIDFVGEGQASWALTVLKPANYAIRLRYSLIGADAPLALMIDGVQKGLYKFLKLGSV